MPNYPPLFEIRQWIFFIRMTNKDLKHTVEALLTDTHKKADSSTYGTFTKPLYFT